LAKGLIRPDNPVMVLLAGHWCKYHSAVLAAAVSCDCCPSRFPFHSR